MGKKELKAQKAQLSRNTFGDIREGSFKKNLFILRDLGLDDFSKASFLRTYRFHGL